MNKKLTCHLCRLDYTPCELSHILPAFVYRWLKKTSATGHMRFSNSINRRTQDGEKCYFLCPECEDLFQKYETYFSCRLFYPADKDCNLMTSYDSNFLNFATSCVWRALEWSTEFNLPEHFRGRHAAEVKSAKENWRGFLLGNNPLSPKHTIHYLYHPRVIASSEPVKYNMNRFFMRMIGAEILCRNSEALTYVKLGPFSFFGLIRYDEPEQWVGTKIEEAGVFEPHKTVIPAQYGKHMESIARQFEKLETNMSAKQLAIIDKSYESDLDRAAHSATFEAFLRDEQLKGQS